MADRVIGGRHSPQSQAALRGAWQNSHAGGPLKPGFGLGGVVGFALNPPTKTAQGGAPGYDFNIRNYPQFVEKLRYIHRNPVKCG